MLPDLIEVVARVAAALEGAAVPYLIGGSLASSRYGIPRATQDADLVAGLQKPHIPLMVTALEGEFYVDADQIDAAIAHSSSFNVIHLTAVHKVDVFVAANTPWARQELARRRLQPLSSDPGAPSLYFCSPEDLILHKLDWYRQGGGISERQWNDVAGVLKVQADALDLEYLRHWAAELGLSDLLARALAEASGV